MIDFVLENHTTVRTWGPAFFRHVIKVAEPYLKIPRRHTAELGIVLVGPSRIRALNTKWRHINKVTDVLSFALPMRTIAGYTAVSLGDLFICPAVVREKAAASGSSLRDQMTWTVVHGLLHLAGYSHVRMAGVEQKILKRLL